MCVILEIEPKVVIPADKLERACDINPDGFGLAYVDKESIQVIRSVKNNDPKEVADHLQRLNKHKIFLHLRYATQGKISEDNNHPFVVLSQKKKIDIAFMHNGTITQYSPGAADKDFSDTYYYAKDLIRPLAHRTAAAFTRPAVLTDTFFQKLASHPAGMSVIVFFDRWGNVLKINEKRGKQFEGWWASNEYSFDDQHSRSSARSYGVPYQFGGAETRGRNDRTYNRHRPSWRPHTRLTVPWEADPAPDISSQMLGWETELAEKDKTSTAGTPFETVHPHDLWACPKYTNLGTKRVVIECKAIGDFLKPTEGDILVMKDSKPTIRDIKVRRQSFVQLSGIKDLSVVGNFSAEDLEKLCKEHPVGMSQLIIDLFGEYSTLKLHNMQQTTTIKNLSTKLEAMTK